MSRDTLDYLLTPRLAEMSPYLADYFGVWCIHEPVFRGLVERANGLDLHAHLQAAGARSEASERNTRAYAMTGDGVALISIQGPTMKFVPSLAEGTSTVRVRQQLAAARRDDEVRGAMLVMDTPGGTSKGNSDLADEVARFAAVKPIFAFVEDLTASAGVNVASQATKRYANTGQALYGAMGTYAVVQDMSGMAEQLGVKVHVVRAGQFKGAGTPGTEITEEQLAEIQRVVDALNDDYLAQIARGTGLSDKTIRALADGRIILAADAVEAGLLDGVQTYEATYAELVATSRRQKTNSNSNSDNRSKTMPGEHDTTKTPATLAELKKTFPRSTAEWRESQLEDEATLSEAAVSYAHFVEQQAAEKQAALEKQLEEAQAGRDANSGSLGHEPLRPFQVADDYVGETGDPVADFHAAVAQVAGRQPTLARRQNAIRAIAQRQPDLYEAYLLSTNAGRRQQRLIKEKLEASQSS